jgi:hypothetical protein
MLLFKLVHGKWGITLPYLGDTFLNLTFKAARVISHTKQGSDNLIYFPSSRGCSFFFKTNLNVNMQDAKKKNSNIYKLFLHTENDVHIFANYV